MLRIPYLIDQCGNVVGTYIRVAWTALSATREPAMYKQQTWVAVIRKLVRAKRPNIKDLFVGAFCKTVDVHANQRLLAHPFAISAFALHVHEKGLLRMNYLNVTDGSKCRRMESFRINSLLILIPFTVIKPTSTVYEDVLISTRS